MTADALLRKLPTLRVNVSVDRGELVIDTPRGMLTEALADEIRAHKAEIIDLLKTRPASQAASTDQQEVSERKQKNAASKCKPSDTTDTPDRRSELKALLDQYPEACPFVSDALEKGAWFGNCIGAMQQWALGDPEYAKEILNEWVVYWKGYPENYEALLEEARKAFNTGK